MADVNVIITGPYAFLTQVGDDRPRPFVCGARVTVSQAEADDLVANGVGLYADAVSQESAGDSEIEDQYSDMDLAALRAAAASVGIDGMERANTKTVLAALREQESAGDSETRIGSGERR